MFYLDSYISRINGLAEDASEDAVGEAGAAHPAEMFGGEVAFGDNADGLREKRQGAAVSLRHRDQIQGRTDALDDLEGCQTWTVGAIEVQAHGVARAAGQLSNSDGEQGASGIVPPGQPVPDLVGYAVTGAAGDGIVLVDVQSLGNLDAVAVVGGRLDVKLAAGSGEHGGNVFVVQLLAVALTAEGVDEHLEALLALGGAIGLDQQALGPRGGQRTVGLVQLVADDAGPDDVLGDVVGVLHQNVAVGGALGPQDVEERDGACRLAGAWERKTAAAASGVAESLVCSRQPVSPLPLPLPLPPSPPLPLCRTYRQQ